MKGAGGAGRRAAITSFYLGTKTTKKQKREKRRHFPLYLGHILFNVFS